MFDNFPYTNFHEMNLDWMIKIAKDFLDQYTHIQETITQGLEDLDQKAQDLEQLLQAWYDEHSQDIADQLADALNDLNDWYTEHQGYLDQYLLDSIEAFRTAADAKAAQTIASIPADYSSVANDVNSLNSAIETNKMSFTMQLLGWQNGTGFIVVDDVMSPGEVLISTDYDVIVSTDFTKYVASIYYFSSPTNKYPAWQANAAAPYTIPKNQYFTVTVRYKEGVSTLAQEDVDYIPTVTFFLKNIGVWREMDETRVTFGYSRFGSRYPEIFYENANRVSVKIDGYISWANRTTRNSGDISTYNTNPNTFILSPNQGLVFDNVSKTISVVDWILPTHTVLLYVSSTGIISYGQWITYLNQNALYKYFKDPIIPVSPRNVNITQSSYAADQSACYLYDWIVCFDAQESGGLVYILNKNTKELIKMMSHTLGHASFLSYNSETDSLMITGTYTYILPNAINYIENNTAIAPENCISYAVPVGVFGETKNVSYFPEQGTADTLANYTIHKYELEYLNGNYTGNYTEIAVYKNRYRMPIIQDLKYYDGFLYQGVGFHKASIYKIQLSTMDEYEIVESYDIPNDSVYEMEGVCVDDEKIECTIRNTNNLALRYFVKMNK